MSLVTSRNSASAVTLDEPPDSGSTKRLSRLSLNPDAQEFVPSSSRSITVTASGNSNSGSSATEAQSKANLDGTNTSDDEYRQFWRSQLPDDLISDSDFSSEIYSATNQYDQQQRDYDLNFGGRSGGLRRNERTNGSCSQEEKSASSWPANGGMDGVELEQSPEEIHPLTLLATEFPNFGVQSLSDIYSATGCDLSLTIEMLTQLELQEEGAPSRRTSRPAPVPSLTPTDFPSLPGVDIINGLSGHQEARPMNPQRPMELATSLSRRLGPGEQGIDFAAVVRKQAQQVAHQQSSHWPFERSAGDITIGPGRSSSAQSLGVYGYNNRPPQQPWVETGEAVATMYSDMREEARDHARVRNAYFEQARQAYLVGNKALAKELSAKGQWHNEQMKSAHGKAAEAIFHQRNASLLHLARDGNRMIDLHGLHVAEAIPLLRRELSALRIASRVTSKRQCVYVCVGTGHHTKGARTPARVPIAIERYLAEDERVQFSEVQPGMLRVFVQ